MPNILVLAETREDGLHPISLELIRAGRHLAQGREDKIFVTLLGSDLGKPTQVLLKTGVNAVYVADHPLLTHYSTDAYVNTVSALAERVGPEVVLIGQTPVGRDLAPRLAFRLDTAVAMDCVAVERNEGGKELKVARPIFGGSVLGTYGFGPGAEPRIITIRSKVFEPVDPIAEAPAELKEISVDLTDDDIRTKTLDRVSLLKEGEARLEDADIIVSGGWGLGGQENYGFIEDLAKAIGGVPGASRPICDLEWTDHSRHIGLTGKMVAPDLYVAVAISGAMHHIAGCSGSKIIVGINIDPKASIFKYAKYGIVGDYAEIVPALIRALEKAEA